MTDPKEKMEEQLPAEQLTDGAGTGTETATATTSSETVGEKEPEGEE
jgi:hypothetical protein